MTNDFKPFAIGAGANVMTQADWEALAALQTGFQAGKASSAQINKAIRQASFIAAALAQFVSEKSELDVLDDGDLPGFVTKMMSGFAAEYLSRENPFGDIAADGPAAIAQALANLRLGAGAPAIGIPFFWPSTAMPNTVMDEWSDMVFLKWNGATFSATEYPKLALVIPSLKLQESRGEFIRVWDDGRGVDNGRTLLSAQSDLLKSHSHAFTFFAGYASGGGTGAVYDYNGTAGRNTGDTGGAETRPRNIAFNFLVRAK